MKEGAFDEELLACWLLALDEKLLSCWLLAFEKNLGV